MLEKWHAFRTFLTVQPFISYYYVKLCWFASSSGSKKQAGSRQYVNPIQLNASGKGLRCRETYYTCYVIIPTSHFRIKWNKKVKVIWALGAFQLGNDQIRSISLLHKRSKSFQRSCSQTAHSMMVKRPYWNTNFARKFSDKIARKDWLKFLAIQHWLIYPSNFLKRTRIWPRNDGVRKYYHIQDH